MYLVFQYIGEMLPYALIGLILCIIYRSICCYKKKEVVLTKEILNCFFVAYLFCLASQTIIPRFNCGIDSVSGKLYFDLYLSNEIATVNIIPFKSLGEQIMGTNEFVGSQDLLGVSVLNFMANIGLFLPLGFFVPIIWNKFLNFKSIFFVGFLTSITIEVIQYFIGRSSDIDDVILNTIGVAMGYLLLKLIKKIEQCK